MHFTVFDTPIIRQFLYLLALFFLKILGWRREGPFPYGQKCVLIAAPHTSNWDLFYTLCLAFAFKVKPYWMGKDTLFRGPFGGVLKWLGGVAIDRSKSNNMVSQSIEAFKENDQLVLLVPPEGTRSKVRYWKTGFYYIAHGAGVPIVLGFVDYKRKVGGFGPTMTPAGDIDADMEIIRAFYATVGGKHPDQTGEADVSGGK